MSYTIANYTFLPWLRQGIANKITSPDGDAGVKVRAKIKVDFKLDIERPDGATAAETFSKDVEMYGPGDIIGIDAKVVIKHDPMNWVTDFEPNYLPYVEFYDESFPWRYTPAAPSAEDRLRPWLTLVVLEEGTFKEGENIQGRPLSYIKVPNAGSRFPPADQLWAWAHVHVSESLMDNAKKIVETDANKTAAAFQAVMNRNPDLASSRILCPVKLANNKAYHAFLIPTFESGRLAGLGLDPLDPNMPHATFSAWGDYTDKAEAEHFPVYYRWFFRTGNVGDFEYLVRLLKPQPVDKRVGVRDIDVQHPGSNIRGITNPALGGILKLGGALKVPFITMSDEDKAEVTKYDTWDETGYPQPFQEDLAAFINLADEYNVKTSADANADTNLDEVMDNPDPLITPPLYGRWHALTDRLLTNRDGTGVTPDKNWVHQLNLDPRWRVPAGYGTKVVQLNQESYMEAAWKQVGDVLEGNRKLRYMHFAWLISSGWYQKHIGSMVQFSAEKALMLTAPVQRRVLDVAAGVTVQHQVDQSVITRSLTSPTMRKLIRPGGRAMKRTVFNGEARPDNLITRVNEGKIVIAPPKVVPETLPTVNEVADDMMPKNIPPFILDLMRKAPWLKWALIIAIVLLFLLMFLAAASIGIVALLGVITAGLALLLAYVLKWNKAVQFADSVSEENQTPGSVDDMPKSPDFVLSDPGSGVKPTIGTTDSVEAVKFKLALKDALGLVQTAKELGVVTPRPRLNIASAVDVTYKAIDPAITIPKHVFSGLHIPDRIREQLVEDFVEVMEYPKIELPMYEPLKKMSKENFLPNLNFISQNSISLMETNQRFIEAYMVGLNHEFSRELFWREYPTDQRGSYFRQFWDVDGYFDDQNRSEEQLKEDLKDIPPIHRWPRNSKLGDHDHREEGGDKEEEVVLVIRGELLKKYPNAVIYAHKAAWEMKDGEINNKVERKLAELTAEESIKPPRNKVKSPLYEARVEPDLYFFGFDLTVKEALGASGESPSDIDKPGWFFCIKERPGEPRYGLDIDQDAEKPEVWNDLAWTDVMPPDAPPGSYIPVGNSTIEQDLNANPPTIEEGDGEKMDQHADDMQVFWKKNMNAADIAYILYQVPVLMAVHAGEMLPKQQP